MSDMTRAPEHAKPARRDLLWVLVLILACGLLEVWASWLQIGAVSGFPKLGGMTTGWILPVTSEAYWGSALYAWLAAPAGPRSRRFAMWSAAAVFVLSLCGQESGHLLAAAHRTVPPVWVVGFVTALPLITVALIAVLIHLRHTDRDEAVKAEEAARRAGRDADEAAIAADERTALRAELEAERAALQPLRDALATAEADRDEAAAKAERLAQKLAVTARKRRPATARKPAPATAPVTDVVTGSATAPVADDATAPDEAPADLDSEAKVLWYLDKGYSASKAGIKAGLTDSRGRQIARIAAAAPADPQARSES